MGIVYPLLRYVYPAIAVFYADNEGLLQPLAIQLTRNGDDRVYTPLVTRARVVRVRGVVTGVVMGRAISVIRVIA